ncbi:Hypothetical protein A7982_03245 [Minicystis rosea]|nr:Hypothetical protein A7982_03245 [Minicystis rosea]
MRTALLLSLTAPLVACGNGRDQQQPPPAPTTTASVEKAPSPEALPGPFSVVLESRAPVVFSALENGVVVADAARARWARATGEGELADGPMPAGLPSGPGRILRASGRMPNSIWLSFEKQKDDGKPEAHPLFRLGRDGFKQLAEDWKPAIAPWSKHRILAASTSSGHLKIKVVEPSLPKPPDDLPNVHLADPSCEKTLVVSDLAAVRTGEVWAPGVCKPDIAAGAGASAKRYVVIRWPASSSVAASDAGVPLVGDAGSVAAGSAAAASVGVASAAVAAAVASATTTDAGAIDTAAVDAAGTGPVGIVDVLPGVSSALAHQAMFARSASDVYVAALEDIGKPPSASRLYHFDGATWGAEPLPAGVAVVRGLAGTADGVLWLVTDHALWRRASAGGSWEQAPLGAGTWEMFDIRVVGERDVWIAARRTATDGPRDVILRTRSPKTMLRWE